MVLKLILISIIDKIIPMILFIPLFSITFAANGTVIFLMNILLKTV